ncbi:hypothetical protein CCACVL1_29003 [Corchorus capsularis]|uniref:Uncharacterized protein n=1 Tax=Corchorus capsularis TaxID=210143 RepID=A0A1R3G4A4_COCAP|nr:hypothetical protein CCACVL1_29003 [Corchorus capsularis]
MASPLPRTYRNHHGFVRHRPNSSSCNQEEAATATTTVTTSSLPRLLHVEDSFKPIFMVR